MPVVTLTTDFGTSDPFAGIMKGVMLGIEPSITTVDITHGISPRNIRQAACVISSAFGFFPKGTAHAVVVDPGVGSGRRPILFEAGGHYFIGPDNGVFTEIMRRLHPSAVYEILNPEFMLYPVSATFHGRDIFAPAAAWLAKGAPPPSFGPITPEPVKLDLPEQIQSSPNMIEGEIIHIDHFGNAITNLTHGLISKVGREMNTTGVEIQVHGEVMDGILPFYGAAPDDGRLHAVSGSWETVEIFTLNGSAAASFNLSVGDHVEARFY